nr:MAG TPA: hypothetical protein [Caudoviricetes sp.]
MAFLSAGRFCFHQAAANCAFFLKMERGCCTSVFASG